MKFEVLHKQLNLFKMWDGLPKVPNQSLVIDSFRSLRQAVNWMEAFDLLSYSPKIAYEAKLPALITEMAVITDKDEVVVSKSYLYDESSKGVSEGIYLLVNTDFSLLDDFLKLSKLNISSMKNVNEDGKTFLVATKDELEKMRKNELKIRATPKNIRPGPNLGMNLN